MKVKDILKLVENKYVVIIVGDKTYDYNFGIFQNTKIRRQKRIWGHYKTSEDEENDVLDKKVTGLASDRSGVISIIAKDK